MSNIAIAVEKLGKVYRVGRLRRSYSRLSEKLGDLAAAPFEHLRQLWTPPSPEELLWALRDVSFEVRCGEVLGFVGANGAGKSTLLKILSRVTEPTEGCASYQGRLGSLLEVGIGFHPELTGRENIFLSGAILGMKRREILKRFDEIVEFADIGKLLDTPIKRYSSGMNVRLGFAVAAHLEPDILIVDEVLAVGDVQFQSKCLRKMDAVSKKGRTILFVSHNMAAISAICDRAIWMERGRLRKIGVAEDIVAEYLTSISTFEAKSLEELRQSGQGKTARFSRIELVSKDGINLMFAEPVQIAAQLQADSDCQRVQVRVTIHSQAGSAICTAHTKTPFALRARKPNAVSVQIPHLNLAPGEYFATCSLEEIGIDGRIAAMDAITGCPRFRVLPVAEVTQPPLTWHSDKWGYIVAGEATLVDDRTDPYPKK